MKMIKSGAPLRDIRRDVPYDAQVNHDVVVDTSLDPSVYVTRVYTTLEDGAYGVGEEIPITVVFSAPVRFR